MKNKVGLFLLSVLTDPAVDYNSMLGLEKIAAAGYKAVQFTDFRIMEYGRNFFASPQECRAEPNYAKFFAKAQTLALEITALNIDVSTKDERSLAQRIGGFAKIIDLAAGHGVPTVIGHGGERISEDDAENRRTWDRLIENLKCLTKYASVKGVNVALEPGGPRWMVHGWKLLQRVRRAVGEKLKINVDPANIVMAAEDPGEGIEVLKEAVVHCHFKDAAIIGKNTAVEEFVRKHDKLDGEFSFSAWLKAVNQLRYYREEPYGEGSVNFEQMIAELKSVDYRGPFIIEREGGQTKFEDAAKARAILDNYLN